MNLWHTSTELHTTATAAVAKALYLAARLEMGHALGLGLDTLARVEREVHLSGMSDTSG